MKVTLDIEEELAPALQTHLETGISVQGYIKAALQYFNGMLELETKGRMCGHGDASRFRAYNTECSPRECLNEYK